MSYTDSSSNVLCFKTICVFGVDATPQAKRWQPYFHVFATRRSPDTGQNNVIGPSAGSPNSAYVRFDSFCVHYDAGGISSQPHIIMFVTSDVQCSRHFVPFDVFKSCAKRPSAGSLATCTSSSTLLSGIVLVIVCHHFDLCFSVLMCYSDAIPYMLQHTCHSGIQYYTDTLIIISFESRSLTHSDI